MGGQCREAGKQEELATDLCIEPYTTIRSWPTNSYIKIQLVNIGWFETRVPRKMMGSSFFC